MSVFKLKSDFKPTGDQPQAIEKLVRNIKNGVREQTLLGATGTGKLLRFPTSFNKSVKNTCIGS